MQGLIWMAGAVLVTLLLGRSLIAKAGQYLLSAMAALVTAAAGLYFQIRLGDTTPLAVFLLRILLSAGSTALFCLRQTRRWPLTEQLTAGLFVLALAQLAPVPWLGLGFAVCGVYWSAESFAGAALAGLALDLAQVTPIPMTAVGCVCYFVRQLPMGRRWPLVILPAGAAVLIMAVCGVWDPNALPGLLLGGLVSLMLPRQKTVPQRRGEAALAQVRLEIVAGVFAQLRQLLLETPESPIDEDALIRRAAERACVRSMA